MSLDVRFSQRIPLLKALNISGRTSSKGCGVRAGGGVVRSRIFWVESESDFFCSTPTPDVKLDCFIYPTQKSGYSC